MSDDKKLISSIDELISRISTNFESDVLRLIKTQSMIKSSEEIINDEVEYLKNNIELISSKLDEISIKTSEINEVIHLSAEKSSHSNAHFERYLNEYLDLLTSHSNELKKLKNHLADRLTQGSASLKSLQKYYIAELKAFEQEVDLNLDNFKAQLEENIVAEDPNNGHSEQPKSSDELSEFKANKAPETEELGVESLEKESEVIESKPKEDQPQSHNTQNGNGISDISREKAVQPETVKPQQAKSGGFKRTITKERYESEQQRLESEFRSYKETFKKKPQKKPPVKETLNGDEFYQKMFLNKMEEQRKEGSGDIRKFVVIAILLVWVIAVFGFYMYFLKKDESQNVISDGSYNTPVTGNVFNNREIAVLDQEVGNGAEPEETNELNNSADVAEPLEPVTEDFSDNIESPGTEEEIPSASGAEVAVTPEPENQPPAPEYDYTVIVRKANMRKGPGKSYAIVDTLNFGKQLESLDEKEGIWIKVKSENGTVGWIGKRLILQN